MNSNQYMCNICIFKYRAQPNYIIGHIYFMNSSYSLKASRNNIFDSHYLHKKSFSIILINLIVVKKLGAKYFNLLDIKYLYKVAVIWYIISEILGHYYAKIIWNQKIGLGSI